MIIAMWNQIVDSLTWFFDGIDGIRNALIDGIRNALFAPSIESVTIEQLERPFTWPTDQTQIHCEYCGMGLERCGCGRHSVPKQLPRGIITLPQPLDSYQYENLLKQVHSALADTPYLVVTE